MAGTAVGVGKFDVEGGILGTTFYRAFEPVLGGIVVAVAQVGGAEVIPDAGVGGVCGEGLIKYSYPLCKIVLHHVDSTEVIEQVKVIGERSQGAPVCRDGAIEVALAGVDGAQAHMGGDEGWAKIGSTAIGGGSGWQLA